MGRGEFIKEGESLSCGTYTVVQWMVLSEAVKAIAGGNRCTSYVVVVAVAMVELH